VEGRNENDAGAVADPRLVRVGGDAAHVVPRPLATQAPKRQDGMELDRVRRDAGLAVLEVKEEHAGDGRPLAEPHRTPGLRHLSARSLVAPVAQPGSGVSAIM
jgi:hypothetical protein